MEHKIVIKHVKEGVNIKVYSENPIKPIGGHRFVGLLNKKQYDNAFTLILGFLGLKPFERNIYADIGRHYENIILDKVWGKDTYESFSYEDYQGDMFPNLQEFNGLIDGLHKQFNKIAEVKCYFNRAKLPQIAYDVENKKSIRGIIDDFELQTRFYLWALNANDPSCKITKAEIITVFIPNFPKTIEDVEILDKYINTFTIINSDNDGFNNLIDEAVKNKKQLMKKHKDKDGSTYYECNVLYDDITQKTLKTIKALNDGTPNIDGVPIKIIQED